MIWNEDRTRVSIRQSWLGDALECLERGRIKSVYPELDDKTGDQAASGTAVHTGIQAVLEGDVDPTPDNIAAVARDAAFELAETENIVWDRIKGPNELAQQSDECARVWLRDIYPHVPLGGRCEVTFEVPALYLPNLHVQVVLKGTADYVLPTELWDWKNSGRAYEQWKKQRYDHQSEVYDLAATLGGFGEPFKPTRFVFGVVDKQKMVGQLVPVHRTMSHHAWLLHKIERIVTLAVEYGTDKLWPVTEDGWLCSPKFCPAYDMCRGRFIGPFEDSKISF
jgi:hypothetical protein